MEQITTQTPTLEDNLDVIYGSLYLPKLTLYLENLLSSYVDAYYQTLAKCSAPGATSEDMHLLELLAGPINEIYNPENTRITSGGQYPAVNIILDKIDEYTQNANKASGKSNTRVLSNPKLPPLYNDNNSNGFFDLIFIFAIIAVSIIFLVYVAFLLIK